MLSDQDGQLARQKVARIRRRKSIAGPLLFQISERPLYPTGESPLLIESLAVRRQIRGRTHYVLHLDVSALLDEEAAE